MKKVIALVAMLIAGSAQAGLWDSAMTSGWEDVKPDNHYKVDVYGYDARVYEFTPKNAKDTICIMLASGGDTNGIQMDCVPKQK